MLGQRNADGTSQWNFLKWIPAECDAKQMLDGFFWHPTSEPKSRTQLEDTNYTTVGRNCVLLLGFAPDQRGLFDRKTLDSLAAQAIDGDLDTSWQPTATTGALILDLGGPKTFDVVSIQEDLRIGQRTQTFAVDTWTGSQCRQIATDTTIGSKKLLRLTTPATTSKLRLRITAARATPAIAAVGLFHRPTTSD